MPRMGSAPAEKSPIMKASMPGSGSSELVIDPADGSIWTCLNQTYNLVAFDGTSGKVILDVPFDVEKRSEHSIDTPDLTTPDNPLNIAPTALAFTPDGSVGFDCRRADKRSDNCRRNCAGVRSENRRKNRRAQSGRSVQCGLRVG